MKIFYYFTLLVIMPLLASEQAAVQKFNQTLNIKVPNNCHTSYKNKMLGLINAYKVLKLYDINQRQFTNSYQLNSSTHALAEKQLSSTFNSDGTTIAVATPHDGIHLIDTRNNNNHHVVFLESSQTPLDISYSQDGFKLLITLNNAPCIVYDCRNHKIESLMPNEGNLQQQVFHKLACFTDNSDEIAFVAQHTLSCSKDYIYQSFLGGKTPPSHIYTHKNACESLEEWHITALQASKKNLIALAKVNAYQTPLTTNQFKLCWKEQDQRKRDHYYSLSQEHRLVSLNPSTHYQKSKVFSGSNTTIGVSQSGECIAVGSMQYQYAEERRSSFFNFRSPLKITISSQWIGKIVDGTSLKETGRLASDVNLGPATQMIFDSTDDRLLVSCHENEVYLWQSQEQ